MNIADALVALGYDEFVCNDTYESIIWVTEPSNKPTKQEVLDAVAALPTKEQKQAERQAKLDSAITKLKALGLTEAEAKVVIGIE
jgi:hypothetical protein